MSMSLLKTTLKANISSVRVPSLPIWRRRLNFEPIHCATVLCLFGQLRNGSAVTHLIHFSSTETSSATGEYVTVPEHIGEKEEPTSRKEDRARNKPSSAPKMDINEAQYDRTYIWACKY